MRADRRVGGAAQFVEQVLHLLDRQRIVGLDRRVTGDGRGEVLDAAPLRRGAPRSRPSRSSARTRIAAAAASIFTIAAPPRRGRCDRRTARHSKPRRARSSSCAPSASTLGRRQLDHERRQQALALERRATSGARGPARRGCARGRRADRRCSRPSLSMATMKVSRSWPSGTIGRTGSTVLPLERALGGLHSPGRQPASPARAGRRRAGATVDGSLNTPGSVATAARRASAAPSAGSPPGPISAARRSHCQRRRPPEPPARGTRVQLRLRRLACPSASISAAPQHLVHQPGSRNRTSALVGCTLTSTRSGASSRNRCTSGLRSRIVAVL